MGAAWLAPRSWACLCPLAPGFLRASCMVPPMRKPWQGGSQVQVLSAVSCSRSTWGSAMSAEQSAAKKHPSKPTRTNLFVSSVLGGVPALVHIVLANDCWNKFVCSPYARMPQLNSAAAGRVILGYRVRAHLACAPHLRFGRLGWVFGQAGQFMHAALFVANWLEECEKRAFVFLCFFA